MRWRLVALWGSLTKDASFKYLSHEEVLGKSVAKKTVIKNL